MKQYFVLSVYNVKSKEIVCVDMSLVPTIDDRLSLSLSWESELSSCAIVCSFVTSGGHVCGVAMDRNVHKQ